MFTIILVAAALLAVYLGFRYNRQRQPLSPPSNRDHFTQANQQTPASDEPNSNLHSKIGLAHPAIPRALPKASPAPPRPLRREFVPDLDDYQFPTIDLLQPNPDDSIQENNAHLEQQKNQVVQTLRQFEIGLSRITATSGPAMTLFELVPAAGIRIARIRHLEEELALALAAPGIRVIAPNPGKGSIGIEIPNPKRRMVTMREVLGATNFLESTFSLPIALGKTSGNTSAVLDLAAMPHLLLTGATGQGKSVSLRAILLSLLYKKHPSELKLVLVDLNRIELNIYGLLSNHFLAGVREEAPVITDPRKAVRALNALCVEMDNRYDLLSSADARNIKEYNNKFTRQQLSPERGHQILPLLVVVIDDVMDLLMTHEDKARAPVFRLTENGRAVGIHLILVTSQPLPNGFAHDLLQNIPARATFRLGSKHDSNTVLNTSGAEKLAYPGDMLLSFENEVTHIASAFVRPAEIEAVVQYIASQKGYPEVYPLPEPVELRNLKTQTFDPADLDPLLEEAARLIVINQLGSTSLIQRKMKLGYNRAGRLMDQLEAIGVVGPGKGSQYRDVLIKSEMELDQYLNP